MHHRVLTDSNFLQLLTECWDIADKLLLMPADKHTMLPLSVKSLTPQ